MVKVDSNSSSAINTENMPGLHEPDDNAEVNQTNFPGPFNVLRNDNEQGGQDNGGTGGQANDGFDQADMERAIADSLKMPGAVPAQQNNATG